MALTARRGSLAVPVGLAASALGAVVALGALLSPEDPGLVGWRLSPFWLVVLASALLRGAGAGLAAGLLAGGVHAAFATQRAGWPLYWEDAFRWDLLEVPVAMALTGWLLGVWSDRSRSHVEADRERREKAEQDLQRLSGQARQLTESNRQMRGRLNARISPGTVLYEVTRRLDTSHREEDLCAAALDLLPELAYAPRGSLYLLRQGALRCVATRPSAAGEARPETPPDPPALVVLALSENRLVNFRALGADSPPAAEAGGGPVLCVPVALPSGEVVGVLAVEEIPFLYLSTATERMVGMVGEWLGRALERARLVQSLRARAIVDEELLVFTEAYFRRSLEREFTRAVRSGESFAVLRVSLEGLEASPPERRLLAWKAVGQIILQNLRVTDLVCRHAREGCLWILGPLPGGGEELVRRRVQEAVGRYAGEGAGPALRIALEGVVGPGSFAGPDALLQAFDAPAPGRPA